MGVIEGQMTLIDLRSLQEEKKGTACVCVCVQPEKCTHKRKGEQNYGEVYVLTIAHQEMKLICN